MYAEGHAQDNIHTLHQAWQILQADGAHDKHREKKLAEEKKKVKACVSVCFEPCTHVQSGRRQSSKRGFPDVNLGVFEYVNFNLPVARPFIHAAGLSVSQLTEWNINLSHPVRSSVLQPVSELSESTAFQAAAPLFLRSPVTKLIKAG